MALQIELSEDEEIRLGQLARERSIAPEEMARQLVSEGFRAALTESEKSRRRDVMMELVAETENLGLYR